MRLKITRTPEIPTVTVRLHDPELAPGEERELERRGFVQVLGVGGPNPTPANRSLPGVGEPS